MAMTNVCKSDTVWGQTLEKRGGGRGMHSAYSVFGSCDKLFFMRCTRFIRGMHHLHREFLRYPEYRVRLREKYGPRVMNIFV